MTAISFAGIISRILLLISSASCLVILILNKLFLCVILFLIAIILIKYHPIERLVKSIEYKHIRLHVILNKKFIITDI